MQFFVGYHQPGSAWHFDRVFISVNRLRRRKSPFQVKQWIMDSGAYTEISTHGRYRHPVSEYATEINRWKNNGQLLAAVAQDYMCEPHVLAKTGLKVTDHHGLTIDRYVELQACATGVYILPVLQGYRTREYLRHIHLYGDLLKSNAWVGVGSLCKRNSSSPEDVLDILTAIHDVRPDLRLHGFGLKWTALMHPGVREHLHTSDSMSWSFAARYEGRNANDWNEAAEFADRIENMSVPLP